MASETATETASETATDARMLELLAEVESLRRKARLLDARLGQWEARLDEACAAVDGLLASIEPGRDPESRLADLEARVERLVRRRARPTVTDAPPVDPGPAPPRIAPPAPSAVAIVSARWRIDGEPPTGPVEGGRAVELVADVDGVPPGATVPIAISPLGARTVEVALDAESDGEYIRARWTLPTDSPDRAWCFTARLGPAESTSPPIYLR